MQRKGALPGKIFARCILRRRFAGHFGCMARISCQSQLISDAWRANLAANWRFSRPRPLLGCMERKTCHGLPPGDAPRRNLATARPPGTHRARILPLPVRPRAHQCAVLPPSDARKRISRAFCHRRAPGNASRHNLATTSRPRMHSVDISPLPVVRSRSALHAREWVQSLGCAVGVRRATLSVRGSGHSAFSGLNCWERLRVCAVSVGNHEPASRSAKLCRIMC